MLLKIDQNITMETVKNDLNARNSRNFTIFAYFYLYYRPKYVGLFLWLASVQGWLLFRSILHIMFYFLKIRKGMFVVPGCSEGKREETKARACLNHSSIGSGG